MPEREDQGSAPRRPNAATLLAQIATELFDLHRTADSCGTGGEVVSEGHIYVTLKENPSVRRDLADIREDIAAVYEMRHGSVPSRTALGDAMTVLKGKARTVKRDEIRAADPATELLAAHGVTADLDEHPERLEVRAGNRNPFDVAREVADYLIKNNTPPELFSMGAAAVLLRDGGTLIPLDADGWLAYVAERVNFISMAKDTARMVAPPSAVMKILPAIILPDLPPLDGVTNTPYLDKDGNVIAADGYHPGSRLVLEMRGLTLPPISESPTEDEVAASVGLLIEHWLADFPFASAADMVNVVAALLTMTGRHFFPLAPLFIVDASTPGSGKGLLVITMVIIATGEPPRFTQLPVDGEEQRKVITAKFLEGRSLFTWDESHVISGRSLAMTLTAEVYSDRILGGNKMISVTNRSTQVALGNNVQVWGDMKRRVVPSRLVPDVEHPEHRTDFRYPDLEMWVRQNRGRLLAAALTIWRHWVAKGRQDADIRMGSFERWSHAVGGALEAAGVPGFLSHTSEWLDNSDDDAPEWEEHLAALRRTYAGTSFTALEVAVRSGRGEDLGLPWFKRDPDVPMHKALGYRYRAIRDRWLGPYQLTQAGVSHGRTRWKITVRDQESE
jgi:hypothetical protein